MQISLKYFLNISEYFVLGVGNPEVRKSLSYRMQSLGGKLKSIISPSADIGVFDNVIGDGSKRNWLEKKLEEIGLTQKFIFHGNLETNFLIETLQKMDVLLNLTEFESYGRSVREALMLDLPVITFESTGIKDLLVATRSNAIQIITSPEDLSIEKIDNARNFIGDEALKTLIRQERTLGIQELIRSWI